MSTRQKVFAYIDGTNLHLSTKNMGWDLDYRKFLKLLEDKYDVDTAYYFIGYVEKYKKLYKGLREDGYEVIHMNPTILPDGSIKGNCDTDLTVKAMADFGKYDKAVLVASDGDYESLVEYLKNNSKLKRVIGCSRGGCARKLKRVAGVNIDFLNDFRQKTEYKRKRTP